jgi:hypothetical protein
MAVKNRDDIIVVSEQINEAVGEAVAEDNFAGKGHKGGITKTSWAKRQEKPEEDPTKLDGMIYKLESLTPRELASIMEDIETAKAAIGDERPEGLRVLVTCFLEALKYAQHIKNWRRWCCLSWKEAKRPSIPEFSEYRIVDIRRIKGYDVNTKLAADVKIKFLPQLSWPARWVNGTLILQRESVSEGGRVEFDPEGVWGVNAGSWIPTQNEE